MISAGLPGDTLFGEIVISANGLSLLGGGWGVRLHRGNDGYADVIATLMSDDVIRIKTRVKYQGAWMPWQELANDYSIVSALREKAPGGYGLGSVARFLSADDDLNTIGAAGWYWWTAPVPQNAPNNFSHCAMRVDCGAKTTGNYATQTVYFIGAKLGGKLRRYNVDSEWAPWEWVNPPMQLGVEYRTTERYLGKPVYVKLIDCGNLPDGTTKEVAHGITNLDFIVGAQAIASNSSSGFNGHTYLPAIYNGSLTDRWTDYLAGIDTKNIRIFCGGGLAGCLVYVTFKYTKTTD